MGTCHPKRGLSSKIEDVLVTLASLEGKVKLVVGCCGIIGLGFSDSLMNINLVHETLEIPFTNNLHRA